MPFPTLSRRHAFKLAGLTGASALLARTGDARGKAPATLPTALPQGAGFYRTHVGEFEITVVSDGQFPVQPYPTFGSNASQEVVEGLLRDHFQNPTKQLAQINTLLVRKSGGPVTVIDAGAGPLFGPAGGVSKINLAAAGVLPAEVQTVVFTHLHPDHCGGALNQDGSLAFPNATHHCHAAEREFWSADTPDLSKSGLPEEMKPGMAANAKKVMASLGDKLRTFTGDAHAIAPGLTATLTGAHTPGHCTIAFESGGEKLVYVTDLINHSVLVPAHPEWLVAFDTDREATVAVRKKVFAALAADRTMICGSHLPFPSLGHLKAIAADSYAYVPAPWVWA